MMKGGRIINGTMDKKEEGRKEGRIQSNNILVLRFSKGVISSASA